jgi:hypothetical protein
MKNLLSLLALIVFVSANSFSQNFPQFSIVNKEDCEFSEDGYLYYLRVSFLSSEEIKTLQNKGLLESRKKVTAPASKSVLFEGDFLYYNDKEKGLSFYINSNGDLIQIFSHFPEIIAWDKGIPLLSQDEVFQKRVKRARKKVLERI